MATYTAASGGGNWNSAATWEEGGGYPGSGDNAVFDSGSGNVTVNVASACLDLTCTGYTGTLTMSAQLSIYGNCTLASGMTLAATTYGFTFAATTTGKTITSAGLTHGYTYFNGSGGEWTLQDDMTIAGYPGGVPLTAGTLNLNGKTFSGAPVVTIPSGFTLNIGSGTWANGYDSMTIGDGATVSISSGNLSGLGRLTVEGTGVLNCTGAANITTNGSVTLGSGFSRGTSTLTMWTGSNLSSVNPLYNFVQGVSWYWEDSTVTLQSDVEVKNDFTILAISSYTATFSLNGYTLTVGGNFENNETFTAGTGIVVFNDATKTSTITGSSATTFATLRCQTAGKTVKFKASQTVTVASFDFDGATGDLITLDTDTGSGTWTLSDSTGTDSVTYCDIHRSTATGGATFEALTSNGNVDGGGNSGWSFSAAAATDKMLLMFH